MRKHHSTTTELNDAAGLDPAMIKGAIQMDFDQTTIIAGGAVAAIAAAAAAFMGKGGEDSTESSSASAVEEAEPEPIDVSIPYDAAARLAFAGSKLSASKFQEFEALYLKKTVTDVTAKKMARDVVEMEKVAAKLAQDLEAFN